ncbi:MAG: hypothetical protein ABI416_10395 [Ginsengibacter sp.]
MKERQDISSLLVYAPGNSWAELSIYDTTVLNSDGFNGTNSFTSRNA